MNRYDLIGTLARIAALEHGGSTPGERAAARQARERLADRLGGHDHGAATVHAEEMVAAGYPEVARRQQSVASPVSSEPPDAAEIARRVVRWQRGELSTSALRHWAARVVDRCILPELPIDDVRSIPGEVLLALADPRCLEREHADEVLCFLHTAPADAALAWRGWLAVLASVHGDVS